MQQLSASSGQQTDEWLSRVKRTLENVPLVSNVVLTVMLVYLEKLVETDFSCPCDPGLNIWIVVPYFVVPALLSFILMCFMLEFHFCCSDCRCPLNWARGTFLCSIPAIVWVTLLFLDGRYVACAVTDWSSRYVTIEKNVRKKWCEPTNSTLTQELLIKTQWWFGVSQIAGLGVLGVIMVGIWMYKCCSVCCCCCSCCQTSGDGETKRSRAATKELEEVAAETEAAGEDSKAAVEESDTTRLIPQQIN